jgi:hypothetical protein
LYHFLSLAIFADLSGLDETVVTKLKQELHEREFYVHDPFLAELIHNLANIASPGDNVIIVMNKCAMFEGISCGFG